MRQSNSPIPLGVGVLVLAVCGACVSQSQEGPSAPLPAETGAPKYTAEPVAPPQTEEQSPTPTVNEQTYSVFVIHTVTDFDSFKRYLDKNDEFRRKLGAIAHVLSRVEGQEHQVIVHYIVRDLERVETFLYSDEVAELARQPGSPEDSKIIFADDVEYQVVNPWPPGTFTAFYKFEVRDFDAWKQRFDGNANARQKMGIIGYGVHKARGEDKTVMVHFIATSLDTIRKFTTMPEVLQTFKDAGIQGTPTPLLAMDVEIKRYGGPAASGSSQQ